MIFDFWFYKIGVNVIAADSVKKIPIEEWSKYQNKPILVEAYEQNKKNGIYKDGIAIIPGKVWRGPHKDKYLVFVDLDNQKAIDEVCSCFGAKDLEELSEHVIVEQHKDNLSKAHLYFYSEYPFNKKSSDVLRYREKIRDDEIPAIEVKGQGEHGIAFCSPSLHKDGYPYEILGETKEPKTCGKEVEERLFNIYKKYGLNTDENKQKIPIEKLFEEDFVILEGHNRHEGLLRAMESLIFRNKEILSKEKIKVLAYEWNQEHCNPPLDDKEFEKQWNCAIGFINKNGFDKDEKTENTSLQEEEKENAISKILKTIKERYIEIFKDQFNEFYVTVRINEHVECIPLESYRFKNIIRKEYFKQENKILSGDILEGILKLIESQLMYNEDIKKIDLNLRVAKTDYNDAIYYDITNLKWEIIKTTSEGWDIINNNEIPIFKRYEINCQPQVYPFKDYDKDVFNKFLKLFNVESKKEILLLSVYIISLFIPDIPKPILVLSGAGGGAKTTTFEIIKNVVDPGSVETLSFPSKTDDLIQTLSHHYVNFFDNVSTISEDESDLLCRSVTGAGFSKRALYSNDDDFISKFKRAIGVNSINLATTRADFLDRSLIIKLKRIDKKTRRKKEDIDKEFEKLRPFVLGFIFDVLVLVLEYRKEHRDEKILKEYPRMADFAEWGEIIARCIGYEKNEFINAYQENLSNQNDEVIESSPVAEALLLFIKEMAKEYWQGTPTQLHKNLTDIIDQVKPELKRSSLWPKASNALTFKINEVEPNLKEKGIEIITGEKDTEGNRIIKIRKLDKKVVKNNIEGSEKSIEENDDEKLFNPDIHRVGNSDNWECDNCSFREDIHFMKQHICARN
jgi:hypothetical protein